MADGLTNRLGFGGGPVVRVVARDPITEQAASKPDDVKSGDWEWESDAATPTKEQFRYEFGEHLDPDLKYICAPVNDKGNYVDFDKVIWHIEPQTPQESEDDRLARLESKVDQLAEDGAHAVEDIGDLAMLKVLDGELTVSDAENIVNMRAKLEAARSADGSLAETVDDPTDTKEVAGRTMLQMADGYSDFSELIEDVTGGLLGGAQSAVGPGATQHQQQPQQPQGEAQQQGQPQHQPEQQPATERTSPLREEFEANRQQDATDDATDATADTSDDASNDTEAAAVEADLADASDRQRDAERAAAGDEPKGAARSETSGDVNDDASSESSEPSDRGQSGSDAGDEERTEPPEPSGSGESDTDDADDQPTPDPDPDGDAPDARDDERRGMTAGPSQATEAEIAAESEVAASADVVERAATDNGTGPDDTTDAPDAGEAGSPDQCRFVKDDGEQCQNAARPDGYCWVEGHGPTDADTDDTEAATDGGTA